ncbi:hypothetical protein P7C73_g2917, partial [Tremellales sp. Uapishka_1]
MAPPDRTVGLPYHLIYPLISNVLLAVASFASADSVWYVSASTSNETLRVQCVSNLVITGKEGCIFRGWQYQIPEDYFGFPLPDDINQNLSRVVTTSVAGALRRFRSSGHPADTLSAWALVLVGGVHHAYTIWYSYRKSPAPNADKLYSLAMIHFISVAVTFLFTWVSFIAQAAVIGHSTGSNAASDATQVTVFWGPSTWLVLASAVIHFGWGYEATRWRAALLK